MNRRPVVAVFALSAASLSAVAFVALAGPLDPPAGPIVPTYKTLTEVEPRIAVSRDNTPGDSDATPSTYKIDRPGSYYLTDNVRGASGRIGIEIASGGVTLDLRGFELQGVPGSLDGLRITLSGATNVAVFNGSATGWGANGIDFAGSIGNRAADILAADNGFNGLRAGAAATVTRCVGVRNARHGIDSNSAGTITHCTTMQNAMNGINTNYGCTVSDCIANGNMTHGFNLGGSCTITNCSAYQNDQDGITTGITEACSVTNCTVFFNGLNGISVAGGSTVTNCTASRSGIDGIRATSQCRIVGNNCHANGQDAAGGAGIHAVNTDNRIEGNTCTSADRGIDVDLAGNIIIRNTCSGNTTNWDIVPTNAVAPIVQASVNAAAISGNTYAGSLGSTDPNSNFTY